MTPELITFAQTFGTAAAWVGSVGTIIGLGFVAYQMRQARRIAYGQFVHELDKDYRGYFLDGENVQAIQGSSPTDAIRLADVKTLEKITFFEKVKVLLDQRVIKMSTVDVMFSGRFFALAHSPNTQRLLKENQDHVCTFFALHAMWVEHRKEKNELIPRDDCNLETAFNGGLYGSLVSRGNNLGK